ncbi:MAG: heat-inducible transcriptional repressor HrcA [Pseudomonadales bacterium]|jgi:heat-inducible transcriptional repressor|nr:heat-inducible transcriptional repressor HrcA [Pseudomonadales bacterium]
MPMPEEQLNERANVLLKLLVERYIESGAPVSSRQLAVESRLDISSATVRNVMADLENLGLVTSPHTSAGKVPTAQGLRFFVDSLIHVQPLAPESLSLLRGELSPERTSRELVSTASSLLSGITHMAGLVTLPRREIITLRQVEFLPLSGNRLLVILVVNEKEVENRIIRTHRQFEQAELQQAANFINQHYAGESIRSIRDRLLSGMESDKARMDALMAEMLTVAANVFREDAEPETDYVVAGEGNLLNFVSGEDMEVVRELFEAFARKRDLLHLLDRCLEAEGVHLFIGDESGYKPFVDYSVVTAPYEVDGRPAGVLGVIGPTRMAYQRVIPVVDATARLLSAALRQLG